MSSVCVSVCAVCRQWWVMRGWTLATLTACCLRINLPMNPSTLLSLVSILHLQYSSFSMLHHSNPYCFSCPRVGYIKQICSPSIHLSVHVRCSKTAHVTAMVIIEHAGSQTQLATRNAKTSLMLKNARHLCLVKSKAEPWLLLNVIRKS